MAKSASEIARSDFPEDFLFGASTSALQTEGPEGRGPCTWDYFLEGTNAVDSYHLFKEDVQMLKNMGVQVYRLSMAWSRIVPTGKLADGINQDGIDFYNNLINELRRYEIEPFVTLFHFDLPKGLKDRYDGFVSREIVDDFTDYANICFKEFGDRVKYWTTFNEPQVTGQYGRIIYFDDDHPATKPYIQTHHILLSHAATVKIYREKYQAIHNGEIGMPLMVMWFLAYSNSLYDKDAADRAWDFMSGWYLEPLVRGDYPFIMRAIVKDRLPAFTQEEQELLKGSYDFIAINYYTSRYAEGLPFNGNEIPVSYDQDQFAKRRPDNVHGEIIGPLPDGNHENYIYPAGLKDILLHLKKEYNNPKIYITENGISSPRDDSIPPETAKIDDFRIDFIKKHLEAVREALNEGVNVKGYFIWSLIDCMEMNQGLNVRFGLNYIDYLNKLERSPKKSAGWLADFIKGVKKNE